MRDDGFQVLLFRDQMAAVLHNEERFFEVVAADYSRSRAVRAGDVFGVRVPGRAVHDPAKLFTKCAGLLCDVRGKRGRNRLSLRHCADSLLTSMLPYVALRMQDLF